MSGYQSSRAEELSGSKAMDTSHGQTHRHLLWLPHLLLIESSYLPPSLWETISFFKLCPITKKFRFFIILS